MARKELFDLTRPMFEFHTSETNVAAVTETKRPQLGDAIATAQASTGTALLPNREGSGTADVDSGKELGRRNRRGYFSFLRVQTLD